ncbi:Uncharacterised protein [Moraxella lacunata]|uniref:Uncharacterized protein n=2 Tax=Moraxella lacunata TaxID=477 RepID=A0A378UBX7_MORLA|nr:Uncharacterised protein [Moraxella lacunata]
MIITAEAPSTIADTGYDEENYRIKALQSLASYRKTGLHVTHDELKDWLNDLKDGLIRKAPQCHS